MRTALFVGTALFAAQLFGLASTTLAASKTYSCAWDKKDDGETLQIILAGEAFTGASIIIPSEGGSFRLNWEFDRLESDREDESPLGSYSVWHSQKNFGMTLKILERKPSKGGRFPSVAYSAHMSLRQGERLESGAASCRLVSF